MELVASEGVGGGEPVSRDFEGESPRGEAAMQPDYPPQFGRWLASEYDDLNAQVRRAAGSSLAAHVAPEDLLQESLLIALRKWESSRAVDASSFRAWVMGIARNRIRNVQRSRRSAPLFLEVAEELNRELGSLPTNRADPGETIDERHGLLLQLDSLAPDLRLCVVMRSQLDLPWPTIALVLQRSLNATRILHSRAMKCLRSGVEAAPDC